jgi:hypothetical protein
MTNAMAMPMAIALRMPKAIGMAAPVSIAMSNGMTERWTFTFTNEYLAGEEMNTGVLQGARRG